MYPGAHAADNPDKLAIIMTGSGQVRTYRELDENSLRFANGLRDIGIEAGDTVAVLSDNRPEIFEIFWATQRSGLYFLPINSRLAPREIDHIINHATPSVLLVGKGGWDAAKQLENLHSVGTPISLDRETAGYSNYLDILGGGSLDLPDFEPRGADVFYTSGSTGRPKGIRRPLLEREVGDPGDLVVQLFSEKFGFDRDTRFLSPSPLWHAAPLRACAAVQALGGTTIVMERFDAEASLAAITNHRVTHSQWVPTMFVRMLKLPSERREKYTLDTMQVAIHAGAPCPVAVKEEMLSWWGPIIWEYYSTSEMNGMTIISPTEWQERPGSVGRAVLGEIHICDDDGEELPAGKEGLVFFARNELPFEYFGEPERTSETQHPRNATWIAVGDIGKQDSDGYLYLTDRKSFMIISGGVNIYPREVEDILVQHPQVHDCAVIGVTDEDLGERVKAVVELMRGVEGSDRIAEELRTFLQEQVARFKVPKSVDFVDRIPRSEAGKLLKNELLHRYEGTG